MDERDTVKMYSLHNNVLTSSNSFFHNAGMFRKLSSSTSIRKSGISFNSFKGPNKSVPRKNFSAPRISMHMKTVGLPKAI